MTKRLYKKAIKGMIKASEKFELMSFAMDIGEPNPHLVNEPQQKSVVFEYNKDNDVVQATYDNMPIYQTKGENKWADVVSFFKNRVSTNKMSADTKFYIKTKVGLKDISKEFNETFTQAYSRICGNNLIKTAQNNINGVIVLWDKENKIMKAIYNDKELFKKEEGILWNDIVKELRKLYIRKIIPANIKMKMANGSFKDITKEVLGNLVNNS